MNLENIGQKILMYLFHAFNLISYVCAILKYTLDRKTNEPGYQTSTFPYISAYSCRRSCAQGALTCNITDVMISAILFSSAARSKSGLAIKICEILTAEKIQTFIYSQCQTRENFTYCISFQIALKQLKGKIFPGNLFLSAKGNFLNKGVLHKFSRVAPL